MPKQSAGLLMYRLKEMGVEYLLVHPGGPFWRNKDSGAWSIPKGEFGPDEDPLVAARREFQEEIGFFPEGNFVPLPVVQQKGGKTIRAWAVKGDWDGGVPVSNVCKLEIPPHSGRVIEFPEVDKAEWFPGDVARQKINPAQTVLIDAVDSFAAAR